MKRAALATALLMFTGCSGKHDGPTGAKGESSKPAGERASADTQRVTVNLEAKIGDSPVKVSFDLPQSWEIATNIHGGPAWRPKGSSYSYLLVTRTCGGRCVVDAMEANIDRILATKRAGEPGTVASANSPPPKLEVEVVADEAFELGHLLHRRLPKSNGAPAMFNVICIARTKEMPFFAFIQGQGRLEDEQTDVPPMIAACKSIQFVAVKPR